MEFVFMRALRKEIITKFVIGAHIYGNDSELTDYNIL
jgi:hypothetical protein